MCYHRGPGTGKTTIIKTLIQIFESKGLSTVLAAPTGRAAKRVSETSDMKLRRFTGFWRWDTASKIMKAILYEK